MGKTKRENKIDPLLLREEEEGTVLAAIKAFRYYSETGGPLKKNKCNFERGRKSRQSDWGGSKRKGDEHNKRGKSSIRELESLRKKRSVPEPESGRPRRSRQTGKRRKGVVTLLGMFRGEKQRGTE